MSLHRVAGIALLALALTPAVAAACAVCGAGTEGMRTAFLISTIFLSLLPLALIFGGLIWLRRHAGAALKGEFVDRDDVAIRARAEAERAAAVEAPGTPPLEGESPARA